MTSEASPVTQAIPLESGLCAMMAQLQDPPGRVHAHIMTGLNIGFVKNNKNMKINSWTVLMIVALIGASSFVNAQQFFAGGGATYSTHMKGDQDDLADGIGYFVEVGQKDKIVDHFGYVGTLSFINQKSTVQSLGYKVNSVNASFGFSVWPKENTVSLQAGFVIGYRTSISQNKEGLPITDNSENIMTYAALVMEGDKVDILARYNNSVTKDVFQNLIQLGVYYKFGNN
jgi:hypothetical protein